MRIIITSDLHYNVPRSKAPTRAVAEEICGLGGDVLILAGDSAAGDLTILDEVFGLFESFSGAVLAVAGNHELWTADGADSLHRYEHDLAEACARNGVHYLDATPFLADKLAIVGNVGWYDFTFRPSPMGIPLRFYENKIAPGAAWKVAREARRQRMADGERRVTNGESPHGRDAGAAVIPESHASDPSAAMETRDEELLHLFDVETDIPPASREITTRWMDREHVHLPLTDVEFARRLAAKLREHLQQVEDAAERIVACIHHLPFAELVPHSVIPSWEFATAFLGSELLGETLLDFPKISHVYCGHSHRSRRCRKREIVCTSIGSTYGHKCYEVLDTD
ncbi:MAG: metallophosphoesterase family protein [Phycisphaerae bacterium]|nr:metallophosphoesterase family protein [Phycisphaerae bacterium]